uniref:MANSC domain-containing protein n=1 Tax=Ciona savignyi TaxID=51511 RepID=H2ZBX2_CIOSA
MNFCKNLGVFVLLVLHVILRCSLSLSLSIDQLSDGKTANQIINGLSRPQLQELLNMIENNNVKSDSNSDSCSNKFLENKNKIIRTEESIQNGAKFLKASTKQMSAESCKQLCCDYTDPNNQHTCDLSVIQLSGGGGGKPCCFLFSCTNHSTGKFNCLFSNHDGYNTYRKTLEPVAVQPNNDVIELQEVLETSTTSQTTTTTPQTTTISTTKPTTTESTTTTKEPTTESTTTKPTTTTTEIFTTTSTTSTTKISPTTLKR